MGRTTRNERFEMRMTDANKQLIAKVAALSGQSLTDFATGVLVQHSLELLEKFERTQLSLRDSEAFMSVIDDDSEPNDSLKNAAQKFLADE